MVKVALNWMNRRETQFSNLVIELGYNKKSKKSLLKVKIEKQAKLKVWLELQKTPQRQSFSFK